VHRSDGIPGPENNAAANPRPLALPVRGSLEGGPRWGAGTSRRESGCRGFRTQNSLVVCTRTPERGLRGSPAHLLCTTIQKKREKLRDQAGPNGAWLGKGGFVRWGNRVAKQRRERDSEHKIRSQESANTKERLKKKTDGRSSTMTIKTRGLIRP